MELIEYTNYPRRVKGDLRIFDLHLRIVQIFRRLPRYANAPTFHTAKSPRLDGEGRPLRRTVITGEIRRNSSQFKHFQIETDEISC